MSAIRTYGLVKSFGDTLAVDHLDISVPSGLLYGFLGPNGAGKTTTLKMLTGLLRPTSGTAEVAGFDVTKEPLAVKRHIGVVPENLGLYERLTAKEYLELVGRLHRLESATIQRRRERLLEALDLEERADSLIVDYSTGMRKKVALAAAILPNPPILFLDEPFEGVDAISSRVIKDILQSLVAQRNITVFFSTHIMELVERLCDEVAIIDHGKLVAQGNISTLREQAAAGGEATLEEVFLTLVDAELSDVGNLEWL